MAALQRIQVLRVFDVFSLLECLQNIRTDGVHMVSLCGQKQVQKAVS